MRVRQPAVCGVHVLVGICTLMRIVGSEAEKLIEEGHVEIDGRYEINLGDRVYKDTVVLLDGKIVRPLRRARLFLVRCGPTIETHR